MQQRVGKCEIDRLFTFPKGCLYSYVNFLAEVISTTLFSVCGVVSSFITKQVLKDLAAPLKVSEFTYNSQLSSNPTTLKDEVHSIGSERKVFFKEASKPDMHASITTRICSKVTLGTYLLFAR